MRSSFVALLFLATACPSPGPAVDAGADAGLPDAGSEDAGAPDAGPADAGTDAGQWPPPDGWKPLGGPGGPAVAFDGGMLGTACAYLPGGPMDVDHHNVVHAFDGYFLLPWAPEFGGGGLSVFELANPCAPKKVAEVVTVMARETHAVAFAFLKGKWWAATNSRSGPASGGLLFWDLSNPLQPRIASHLDVPGFVYPDGYARMVQAIAWQGQILYTASGDLGVDVIDASDPENPKYLSRYAFAPTLRVFSIKAIGTLLFVHGAESPRAELLDISDPKVVQPILGGAFSIRDGPAGTPREGYGANIQGGYAYFARKDSGGGVIVYDVRDPSAPVFAGISATGFGNGGYVFIKDDTLAFVGESGGASLYDLSDLGNIVRKATFALPGDLDTIVPVGNVAVLSVDDQAVPKQSSAVVPWSVTPDTLGPHVSWAWPKAGAKVAVTARFGVTLSEAVEPRSVFEGSVRLFETATGKRVDGVLAAQESIVTFSPVAPLKPGTSYTLALPAGGVADWNGNAAPAGFTLTVETEP